MEIMETIGLLPQQLLPRLGGIVVAQGFQYILSILSLDANQLFYNKWHLRCQKCVPLHIIMN